MRHKDSNVTISIDSKDTVIVPVTEREQGTTSVEKVYTKTKDKKEVNTITIIYYRHLLLEGFSIIIKIPKLKLTVEVIAIDFFIFTAITSGLRGRVSSPTQDPTIRLEVTEEEDEHLENACLPKSFTIGLIIAQIDSVSKNIN